MSVLRGKRPVLHCQTLAPCHLDLYMELGTRDVYVYIRFHRLILWKRWRMADYISGPRGIAQFDQSCVLRAAQQPLIPPVRPSRPVWLDFSIIILVFGVRKGRGYEDTVKQ
ncbi:hypothetical protein AcV5_000435 [Taiwanofungus camphoratus]|nr:hypothetical protein AcV7_003626 [Antrodia cinnamomea]KAI0938843.1 hypothetical protein AcV5_000435 [Antrodia cinnamomea]